MAGKAVLAVSFGTSHLDTLEKTIVPIERALAERLPERTLRRAFTSGIIRKKLEGRDGLLIDSVDRALERLAAEGFDDVTVQPTHILNGDEYDKLLRQAQPFREKFARLAFGRPLLTDLDDYRETAGALLAHLPPSVGDTALVLMGHGTEHAANPAYCQLEYLLHDLGRGDVLMGTVEGYPGFREVLRRLEERPEVKKIRLYPFMIVAGDHAKNDLAGEDPDSWKSLLEEKGYGVSAVLAGLGEYPEIRDIFARHSVEAE